MNADRIEKVRYRLRRAKSERGVVLIFVAIALLMLVGFMALAIDVGFVFTAKADLQAAVDAAALAGASGLMLGPDEARARAIEYATKNPVYHNNVQLDLADIELGTWNSSSRSFSDLPEDDENSANSIRVTGNLTEARGNPLTLFFARALGAETADVRAQSVAVTGQDVAWDVVILQDITNSFEQEIDTAIQADRGLLGCLAEHAGEHSRVGFATHTGWGQVRTPLWSIADGYADLLLILDEIDSCGNPGMPDCSGTDTAAGLMAALSIFETSDESEYPHVSKAIVLVSDGQPQENDAGSHPNLNNAQLRRLAEQVADEVADEGISLFTVFYDQSDDDFAANWLEDLTRGRGTFQRTPDPDDLGLLLSEVCSELLPNLRLVE